MSPAAHCQTEEDNREDKVMDMTLREAEGKQSWNDKDRIRKTDRGGGDGKRGRREERGLG